MFGREYTYGLKEINHLLSLHPKAYLKLGLQTPFGYGLLGLENSESLYMDLPRGLEFCKHKFLHTALTIPQAERIISTIIIQELTNSNKVPYINNNIINLAKLHNAVLDAAYCQNLSNAVSIAFGNTIAALQLPYIAQVTSESRKLDFDQGRWIFEMEGKIKIIHTQINGIKMLESGVLKFRGTSILDLRHITPWSYQEHQANLAEAIKLKFPDGFILQEMSFSGDTIWTQRLNQFLLNPINYKLPLDDPFSQSTQLQSLLYKLSQYLHQNDPSTNGSSPLLVKAYRPYYNLWAGSQHNPEVQASAARKLLEAIQLHLCPQSLTTAEKQALQDSQLSKVLNGQSGFVASLLKMITVDQIS